MKYFFWLFFLTSVSLTAQTDSVALPEEGFMEEAVPEETGAFSEDMQPYTLPPAREVPLRTLEKQQWAKASSGLDYSKDVPEEVKEKQQPASSPQPSANWSAWFSWIGQMLQVLAIIAAIAGIAYGIYRTLNAPKNRQIARDGVEITLDNVEQYLHESDLDRFLREALQSGNYPLAIRLYYLQVIKRLSETGAVRWSREKTNRDYLRETRTHRSGEDFRAATRIYERVWYGNQPLDAPAYHQLEPAFKNLLVSL